MSSAVQLKLLTLLNVSAIKRPLELDIPGGHRSAFSITSTPVVSSRETSEAPEATSAGNAGARGDDGEPARKKKKGVVFGGVIGPSGSGAKGKAGESSSSSTTAADKSAGKKSKKDKKREEDELKTKSTNTSQTSKTTINPTLQAEPDSDSDAEDLPSTSTSTLNNASSDPFISHFSISPPILTTATQESADGGRWRTTRRTEEGLGRVVECSPEGGEQDNEDDGSTRVSF